MTLFELIEKTADHCGLAALFSGYEQVILGALLLFSALCCILGFKLCRVGIAGVTFLGLLLFGVTCLLPAWGKSKYLTFCAVAGVALTGAVLFAPRLEAGILGFCTMAGFAGLMLKNMGLSGLGIRTPAVVVGLAASVAVLAFPFWGICLLSAFWGSFTLISTLRGTQSLGPWWLMVLAVTAAGAWIQLLLFRNQKVFAKIMPDKLQNCLNRKRRAVQP